MSWVYLKSESGLYTVGFFTPDGTWEPESDHTNSEDAAVRVHYLNGGQMGILNPSREKMRIVGEPRVAQGVGA